jgi:FkbM family methyltransferase
LIKQIISRIIRNKVFYPVWKYLNSLSHYGMNFGVASGYADYSGELYIIKKLKKDTELNIIFDIGANVGDWSAFVVNEYIDVRYALYMFEPSYTAFNHLQKNITKCENHLFYNMGFGDKKEKLKIFYDYETQGSASLLMTDASQSEEVNIDTLDNFCLEHEIEEIDFLKMDVQGYEYNILLGAARLLQKGMIKNIQFEFDEPNIQHRIFFKDFWNLLHHSYDIYHSLYDGLVKVEEYHYELENFRCMNYLAVKK